MKKIFAVLLSATLALTLFAACKATKAENTLSPNPPTATTEKSETTTIEKEVVSEKENKTEAPAKAPETENRTERKADTPKENPKTTKNTAKENTTVFTPAVTREEAKATALAHAGLSETDIRRYKIELDRERKIVVYEIEFEAGKFEYEYEINAETGKIVKAEKEIND